MHKRKYCKLIRVPSTECTQFVPSFSSESLFSAPNPQIKLNRMGAHIELNYMAWEMKTCDVVAGAGLPFWGIMIVYLMMLVLRMPANA